jgi:hypothetical protein
MERVPWLSETTNDLLSRTVAALESSLGKGLEAAVLIGTSMNPTRGDRGRAPEIVVVASEASIKDLSRLAEGLGGVMREGARLRLLTPRDLERSRDVFALEIAEWKARHRVLVGRDPLEGLALEPKDLRHGIETELRGLTRRMRNRVLTGITTKRDDPREAVVAGYDRLLVASYHLLRLADREPPPEEPAILRAVGELAKADATPLLGHLASVRQGAGKIEPLAALSALLTFTEAVTEHVDAMSAAS